MTARKCDVCEKRRAVGFVAGIHVCVVCGGRIHRRAGEEWVRWAAIEWAWINGHGPDPRELVAA